MSKNQRSRITASLPLKHVLPSDTFSTWAEKMNRMVDRLNGTSALMPDNVLLQNLATVQTVDGPVKFDGDLDLGSIGSTVSVNSSTLIINSANVEFKNGFQLAEGENLTIGSGSIRGVGDTLTFVSDHVDIPKALTVGSFATHDEATIGGNISVAGAITANGDIRSDGDISATSGTIRTKHGIHIGPTSGGEILYTPTTSSQEIELKLPLSPPPIGRVSYLSTSIASPDLAWVAADEIKADILNRIGAHVSGNVTTMGNLMPVGTEVEIKLSDFGDDYRWHKWDDQNAPNFDANVFQIGDYVFDFAKYGWMPCSGQTVWALDKASYKQAVKDWKTAVLDNPYDRVKLQYAYQYVIRVADDNAPTKDYTVSWTDEIDGTKHTKTYTIISAKLPKRVDAQGNITHFIKIGYDRTGAYTIASGQGITMLNENSEPKATIGVEGGKINVKLSDSNNWLKFNADGAIEFDPTQAEALASPSTIAKRTATGTIRVGVPSHEEDAGIRRR